MCNDLEGICTADSCMIDTHKHTHTNDDYTNINGLSPCAAASADQTIRLTLFSCVFLMLCSSLRMMLNFIIVSELKIDRPNARPG